MSLLGIYGKCCKCGGTECAFCASTDPIEKWYAYRDCSAHTYSYGAGCPSTRPAMLCCKKTLTSPSCAITVTTSLGTFNFAGACIQAEETVFMDDYDPFGYGILVTVTVCISISGLIDNGGGNVTVMELLLTFSSDLDGCTTDPNCENISDWVDGSSAVEVTLGVYNYTGVSAVNPQSWFYCGATSGGQRCVETGGTLASSSFDSWSWDITADDPGGYPFSDLYNTVNHYNVPIGVSFEILSGGPVFATDHAYVPCTSDPKCP